MWSSVLIQFSIYYYLFNGDLREIKIIIDKMKRNSIIFMEFFKNHAMAFEIYQNYLN